MLSVIGWIAVAVMAALVATQVAGWSGTRSAVVLQALTPYLLAPALPLTVAAFAFQRWLLGGAAAAVFIALGVMCRPLLRPAPQPAALEGVQPVTIFHGNLLYRNGRTTDLPTMLGGLDVDVLAFTEYTADHAALLDASPITHKYPHRIEHPEGDSGGSAIWSRYPLTEIAAPESRNRSSAAVVGAPQPLTLQVVHPPSPIMSLEGWNEELAALVHALDPGRDEPTVTVGDLNADYWHPPFRRLLRTGWRDAHLATGAGFSSSWPSDKPPLRPFVRLDHALVNNRLVVDDVRDMDIPGSDHRGLVVSVRPASGA